MRKFLIAASAAALAAPVAAQSVPAPYPPAPVDPRDAELMRSIPHPGEIEAVGDAAGRVADAILGVPVGPLREAIEGRPLPRHEREETLGDQAAKDDPYFRQRMRDQIGMASVAVGALAQQMAVVTPVLRQTLEDVQRRVEDAARGIPPQPAPYQPPYPRD